MGANSFKLGTRKRSRMKLQRNNATLVTVLLTLPTLLLLITASHTHQQVEARHLEHSSSSNNNYDNISHLLQPEPTNLCTVNVCQNGATCISTPGGGYRCLCLNGWKGQNCTENVDDCSKSACENGAICVDRVGQFRCECPKGKVGLLCELDDECYGSSNPCKNNATCDTLWDGRAVCHCAPGFTGPDCGTDKDECAVSNPCERGGVCVNVPGTYRCDCAPGFTGRRCEDDINECLFETCHNGGTCLDEEGSFRCICSPGYRGTHCEIDIDECASNPCQNNSTCKDEVNAFRCLCPPGYWGRQCELNSTNSRPTAPPIENPYLSPYNPWSNCPSSYLCWTLFNDGKCDADCNIAECLYDGTDCASRNDDQIIPSSKQFIKPKICDDKDSYCLRNYANGKCDEECNSAECGWDGLDCEAPINDHSLMPSNTIAQGLLVIRVEPAIELGTDPESKDEITKLLRHLYSVTKTVLKIQNYRTVDEGHGTEIELIADNRRCRSSCFNSTDLIARFLTALKSRPGSIGPQGPAGLKINDFYSKPSDQLEPNQQSAATIWAIAGATLTAVCAVLMVISIGNKQKVKEKAVVWFPEGFKPVLSSRNRDPTDRNRKPGRGVSTLQALGGNFFRGVKRNERDISTNPNGLHSTDIDRCTTTPSGGGIYHEPYDYDQYGSTYNGTESVVNNTDEPMTPTPMSVNPLNIEGPHGLTPLMVASMGHPFSKEPLGLVAYGTTSEVEGAENNVTDLLNKGAQLNLASKVTGETALHLAARCGRADNASRLLAYCDSKDVNAKDSTGRTPLHAAIAADSLGVFELLIRNRGTDLNAQTHDGTTPLILAAKVGNYSMLEELILNECEVAKSDANGKTALHWAAAVNNVDIIRRLLDVRETNKDAQDLAEETPLFLAAREGARGAVELLLSHNANRDIKDQMDMSPMDIARAKKHDDIVRLLEEHEPPTPRSITGLHQSRQISPFSPDSNSNSNGSTQAPAYHSHTQSNGGRSQGGRQAQKAAAVLARSSSSKPLIAEANIIRNNLQGHCKSVMVIKSEEGSDAHDAANHRPREAKTLGRRATQSTSSSHQVIQPNLQHMSQFAALSTNNVVMPATPNSLTNSLSPVSSSMMSPPTSHSLHHLGSPTKTNPPVSINQMSRSQQQNHLPPPSYNACQTFWNNNNNPNMINVNHNNNIIDKTHGLSEAYNVPCLKNYMTPSPESPFSIESMASPPGGYDQQYQNVSHSVLPNQKQAGVFI